MVGCRGSKLKRIGQESEGGERYLPRLIDGLPFLALEDESKSRREERDGMMDRLLLPGAEEDMVMREV